MTLDWQVLFVAFVAVGMRLAIEVARREESLPKAEG
jgi:hypothetical protein